MLEGFEIKNSNFNEKIKEKELQIELALNNLKNAYITYNTLKNNENENIYNNAQMDIEKQYADLFKLENEIINNTNTFSSNMKMYENQLENNKSLLKKYKNTLQDVKNKTSSSIPRADEYDYILKKTIGDITFHIFGSFLLVYIIYKKTL
jgi:hypothetical protein